MPELIDTKEVSRITSIPAPTLRAWRLEGRGPKWFKIEGTLVRYKRSDVEAWLKTQYETRR